MKLIGLLLLLLGLVSAVEGEVVTNFSSSCPDFFIKDQKNNAIAPTVLSPESRYKQICQKYNGKRSSTKCSTNEQKCARELFSHTDTDKSNKSTGYRYATLYDTDNKIPVYSAYLYTGYDSTERTTVWMIEPQLDGHSQEEMTREENAGGQVGLKQAVNEDLINAGYVPLYPRCLNCDQDQAESTLTLTNAAPLTDSDSKRWYDQVEKKIAQRMSDKCSERTAHVVSGVVPGPSCDWCDDFFSLHYFGYNLRARVASHFWSAFCCKDRYNQNRLISEGYILEMKGRGSAEAVNQTLNHLNRDLAKKYSSSNFQVFGSIQGCS
ncbi:uncharacterized protein LOC134070203 [Sardina pilchardus]|uniref:uncharacterized protein LOC134070203 n=1 Tax=Sardina pilchardus TaxID=27697 RepID=UPI002E138415